MKHYKKILKGIFVTILIILGGSQSYFSFFLDDQLKETAKNSLHEATDNAYDLEIGELDLWILGRQLNVSDIKVTKKEAGAGTDIRATVDDFTISGISFLKFLFSQSLSLKQVELLHPKIYITSPGDRKEDQEKIELTNMSQQLSEAVLQELDKLSISDFRILGLSLDYNRADLPVSPTLTFKNSDIQLFNITIDSTSLKENRILPADNIATTFRKIHYQTNNELYELTARQLEFSSQNGQMNIDSVKLNPRFNKQEFADKMKYETDHITMELSQISWKQINTEQLNRAEGISSGHIDLENMDIEIYRDKRPPSPPDNRPSLPHEILRNIPFPLSVDSLTLTNSNIRYSERLPDAEKAGFIDFTNLSATFRSLSNDEERWKEGDNPTLHAETNVMGRARLNAYFSFAMTDSSDQQQIKGTLQSMDMQPLNDALIPLAFVRIDDGEILGMDFEMTLGKEQAGGQVTLRYENLKISLLNKEQNKETLGKKALSLLANTFKIKSENTGEDLRIGKVDFERAKDKSTFNYWWKSLLSGLKSSIGF
jgi:hypothetical protein